MREKALLRDLDNENLRAINEMLWNLVHTHHRYFNEIASLANDRDNVGVIAKLLRNIGRAEARHKLSVSVRNENIDTALRRHMLGAAARNAMIHADLDLLADISARSTVGVVHALGKGFENIMARKGNRRWALAIKRREDCIRISVDHASEHIFVEDVAL